jgi:osmotically-inducible protein OsmY
MGFLMLIAGFFGAGLMYFLDPDGGKRRRALMRDQLEKMSHTASEQAEVLAKQAADKARGVMAETSRRLKPDEASDETLAARIRSEMGRIVSHPHAVEVRVQNGVVMLNGSILAHEVQPLVNKITGMPGVRAVEDHLQLHEDASNIPDLQGG